jgi:uncharacterized membrane protein
MRHLLVTIAVLVALACIAGFVSFRLGQDPLVHEALARRDALEWLRADFKLDDAQFASIRRLHESYSVVCEEHCRAIQDAARARNALKASPAANPAKLAAAEQRVQDLRLVCESAIAAHVREVAAQMSPEQGTRYLALVLPKVADFDHQAAPDLGLNAHRH